MTYAEIKTMIAGVGLPYAYYQWHDDDPEKPAGPPFICFYFDRGEDFFADGENYTKIDRLVIEHYADEVDLVTDALIGTTLTENGLTYQWDRQFIRDQRMWQTVFIAGVNIEEIPEPAPAADAGAQTEEQTQGGN